MRILAYVCAYEEVLFEVFFYIYFFYKVIASLMPSNNETSGDTGAACQDRGPSTPGVAGMSKAVLVAKLKKN